jgi:hypothetical protein
MWMLGIEVHMTRTGGAEGYAHKVVCDERDSEEGKGEIGPIEWSNERGRAGSRAVGCWLDRGRLAMSV